MTVATTAPPPPSVAPPVTHQIATGDSLNSIADRHGITVDQLMDANGLELTSTLTVGESLVIPEPREDGDAPPERTHVIVAGDTLSDLAARYDTTVEDIIENNPTADFSTLPIGTELEIPPSPPTTVAGSPSG